MDPELREIFERPSRRGSCAPCTARALETFRVPGRTGLPLVPVEQAPQGSLCPALHRLEKRRLLAAEWRPSETGREAKFYRLTPRGRAQLQEQVESRTRLAGAGPILQTAGGDAG